MAQVAFPGDLIPGACIQQVPSVENKGNYMQMTADDFRYYYWKVKNMSIDSVDAAWGATDIYVDLGGNYASGMSYSFSTSGGGATTTNQSANELSLVCGAGWDPASMGGIIPPYGDPSGDLTINGMPTMPDIGLLQVSVYAGISNSFLYALYDEGDKHYYVLPNIDCRMSFGGFVGINAWSYFVYVFPSATDPTTSLSSLQYSCIETTPFWSPDPITCVSQFYQYQILSAGTYTLNFNGKSFSCPLYANTGSQLAIDPGGLYQYVYGDCGTPIDPFVITFPLDYVVSNPSASFNMTVSESETWPYNP